MSHLDYQEYCSHHFDSEKNKRIDDIISKVLIGSKCIGTCINTSDKIFTIKSVNREIITFTNGSIVRTDLFRCFYALSIENS